MTYPNEMAFPGIDHDARFPKNESGLSKREIFAAIALSGLLGNTALNTVRGEQSDISEFASEAVYAADQLIVALNKEPE